MQDHTKSVIQETLAASNEGLIHFGQVIEKLVSVNVESYSVDYRTGRVTYYLPCGETHTIEQKDATAHIPSEFSTADVKAAILGAQRGEVMYPQFKKLSQAAGCIGYTVWIAGRHVSYFGRKGETHIEKFPG